jgi:hypothetical protein
MGGGAIVEADGIMLGRLWTRAIPGALLIRKRLADARI